MGVFFYADAIAIACHGLTNNLRVGHTQGAGISFCVPCALPDIEINGAENTSVIGGAKHNCGEGDTEGLGQKEGRSVGLNLPQTLSTQRVSFWARMKNSGMGPSTRKEA